MRNPRFKVTFAHANDSATIYGKTDEVLMDFNSMEMMLRVINPMKSVSWCTQAGSLRRHGFMTIQLFENTETGDRIMKVLKIERN